MTYSQGKPKDALIHELTQMLLLYKMFKLEFSRKVMPRLVQGLHLGTFIGHMTLTLGTELQGTD